MLPYADLLIKMTFTSYFISHARFGWLVGVLTTLNMTKNVLFLWAQHKSNNEVHLMQASKMTYIRKCGDTRVNRWLQSLTAQVPEALANRGTGSRTTSFLSLKHFKIQTKDFALKLQAKGQMQLIFYLKRDYRKSSDDVTVLSWRLHLSGANLTPCELNGQEVDLKFSTSEMLRLQ